MATTRRRHGGSGGSGGSGPSSGSRGPKSTTRRGSSKGAGGRGKNAGRARSGSPRERDRAATALFEPDPAIRARAHSSARHRASTTLRVARSARRRALSIAAAPAILAGTVAGVIAGVASGALTAASVAAVVLVVVWLMTWWGAKPMVLRSVGAVEAGPHDLPRISNLVEGLCASMGLPSPRIYLVEDALPDAMAVGRHPGASAIVLTTGLIEEMDPVQLEGVLAHELAHVKRGEASLAAVGAVVAAPVTMLVPGTGELLAHRLVGRGREFGADQSAVEVTRYPPGLAAALAAMDGGLDAPHSAMLTGAVARSTRWMWTVAPGGRVAGDELIGELDSPYVRIAALQEY
ncbi:MAG: M48 family metalloprotease [Acidimicrobiales bacterium]